MIDAKKRAEKLKELINQKEAGYTLTCDEIWRCGRMRTAYVMRNNESNCAPTLYCDEPWYEQDDETVADYLLRIVKSQSFKLDTSEVLTAANVINHVLPRLVPANNIGSLKECGIAYRPYLDLAVIYYLPMDIPGKDDGTIQVTEQLLHAVGLSENDAYNYALKNLRNDVDFLSIGDMLRGLVGSEGDIAQEVPGDNLPMFILTNHRREYGGALLLLGTALFTALEHRFHSKIALLPSSVHELICVFYENEAQLNDYLQMVISVNSAEVAEEDFLANNVYYFDGRKVCAYA